MGQFFSKWALLSCACLGVGCPDKEEKRTSGGPVLIAPASSGPRPDTQAPERRPSVDPTPTVQKSGQHAGGTAGEAEPKVADRPELPRYLPLSERWGPLELNDLGPAASVTAFPLGAVFITRDDRAVIVRRRGPRGFVPTELPKEAFSKYGWGPSVSATHAYWTSLDGHLMRANLQSLKTEALFPRARPTTRTSVQTAMGRDVVAFVADLEERSYAYIWASPGSGPAETLDASAPGHTATSVRLAAGRPHPHLVVLEGRTGMSPVHLRTVRVTKRRVTLGHNEVVWIGPGSHPLTEIHALDRNGDDVTALLPTGKNFQDFGMAQLLIDGDGGEAPEPEWQVYPNGLDPAPVATAHICGGDYVAFARPSERRPRAPQELHLAPLTGGRPQEGDIIARSRAFNDVSLAPIAGGAIAVWTADNRSWAMVLDCPASKP